MAKVAINKSNESFYKDDVVVYDFCGTVYGVKILKSVYVDAVNDYRYIVQPGKISAGKWVGDTSGSKKEAVLYLYAASDIRGGYSHKWTPGADVTKGDVLRDQSGRMYLVESVSTVWSLKDGTHANLSYWEKQRGTLTQVTDATDRPFSKAANIK